MKNRRSKKKGPAKYSLDADLLNRILDQIETQQEEIAELKHKLSVGDEAVIAMRDRYQGLNMLAQTAVLTLDRTGRVREFNDAAAALLAGTDSLEGRPFVSFLSRESIGPFRTQLVHGITASAPITFDVGLAVRQLVMPARLSILARLKRDGLYFLVAVIDRSEMTTTQKNLDDMSGRWEAVVHSAPDVIMLLDSSGTIRFANRDWLGRSASQLLGTELFEYIPPNQQGQVRRSLVRAARNGVTESHDIQFLNRVDRPWFSLRFGQVLDGISDRPRSDRTVYVLMRDMTEQKRAELELHRTTAMLRGLSAREEEIREKERSRIAREIHDELGQTLTVLKMDLEWLKGRIGTTSAAVEERANAMNESLDSLIQSVRRISSELTPPLLDLGLIPAIEWQLEQFQKRAGIRCYAKIRQPDVELDRAASIAVFRVVQEALTNIARHSGATEIEFSLAVRDGELQLSIMDNGQGITRDELESPASFGLTGMRERIHHLGGKFQIERLARGGTIVSVRLPIEGLSEERKII